MRTAERWNALSTDTKMAKSEAPLSKSTTVPFIQSTRAERKVDLISELRLKSKKKKLKQ